MPFLLSHPGPGSLPWADAALLPGTAGQVPGRQEGRQGQENRDPGDVVVSRSCFDAQARRTL